MLISLPPENTSGLQNLFDALSVYRLGRPGHFQNQCTGLGIQTQDV